jgi:hypothetical protein
MPGDIEFRQSAQAAGHRTLAGHSVDDEGAEPAERQ